MGKLRAREGWCKGGLGAGGRRLHDGTIVAAIAVVNAWGDVIDERGEVIAGAVGPDGRFLRAWERVIDEPPAHPRLAAAEHTTLVCVVTDGALTRAGAATVARMAHAGMARAVSPVHTPIDGDAAFCLATGARPASVFAVGVAARRGGLRRDPGRCPKGQARPGGSDRSRSRGRDQRLASTAALCPTSPPHSSTSPPMRSARTEPSRCSC